MRVAVLAASSKEYRNWLKDKSHKTGMSKIVLGDKYFYVSKKTQLHRKSFDSVMVIGDLILTEVHFELLFELKKVHLYLDKSEGHV